MLSIPIKSIGHDRLRLLSTDYSIGNLNYPLQDKNSLFRHQNQKSDGITQNKTIPTLSDHLFIGRVDGSLQLYNPKKGSLIKKIHGSHSSSIIKIFVIKKKIRDVLNF